MRNNVTEAARALIDEVPEADRKLLEAEGYRPVLWWQKGNGLCGTGSALKNIEIEKKRAVCKHVRNGPTDYCRYCQAIMPWGG